MAVRDLYSGEPTTQEVTRRNADTLRSVQNREIVEGVLLTEQSLAAGDNTLNHYLGRQPRGYVVTKYDGAFGTSGGGGGQVYPEIDFPRHSREGFNPGGSVSSYSHTMGYTPADSATLLLGIVLEDNGITVSSITQTGVTWANIASISTSGAGGSATMTTELWIGHTISSAGTGVTINLSGSTTLDAAISIIEVPEINATSARASATGQQNGDNILIGDELLTPPTPLAGDLLVAVVSAQSLSTLRAQTTNGWTLQGATEAPGAEGLYIFTRTAQNTDAYPYRGAGSANDVHLIQAAIDTSIAGVGGGGGSIPHGTRFVSSTNTTITINAVAAVTADIWVF